VPTFSNHALQQMATRHITETDVEFALRREIDRTPGGPGSIWIHGHASGSRVLKVCVRDYDESYVITAAWPDP
jgi:hypothetical protein